MRNDSLASKREIPPALVREKALQCARNLPIDCRAFIPVLQEEFGDAMQAVLLYGSCLHTESVEDGIIDLYILVDDYERACKKRLHRLLNRFLPPNVFYLELSDQGQTLRAKYGLISSEDFEKGAEHWFHSYIWGRFAQPLRILYARDEHVRTRLHQTLAAATLTLLQEAIPALGKGTVDAEAVWTRALALSYDAELRPEPADRARQLTHLHLGDYQRLLALAAPALADLLEVLAHGRYRCLSGERLCRASLRRWRLRAWQGRVLSVLRLAKAAFTFSDCVDYAAWKIERHTGICIDVTPELRRHPLLLGWRVLLQLIRKDAMH